MDLNLKEMDECARNFMNAFGKPEWDVLSLEEWLCEYMNQIPDSVWQAGQMLLKAIDERIAEAGE
jgi:hypothetical protein